MKFNYIYGKQAEQYDYLYIPKAFMKEEPFKAMTASAKIMYALLMEKQQKSAEMGWIDTHDHVFIMVNVAAVSTELNWESFETIAAIEELEDRFDHDLDIIFLESGGDNLAATFSPELVDFTIYIIDVAEGEKIPRKAGQGMIKSDLFVINKIDLAPYVGDDLERMKKDSEKFRADGTFLFTNLKKDEGLQGVIDWIKRDCLLEGL